MADYSKGFKRRVVTLWIKYNMSSNEISRSSGIDHKTLMKWYKRFCPEITKKGGANETKCKDLRWHYIGNCAGYHK